MASEIPGRASIGIIANPAAGRDIRRLVAQASVFPIAEKRNMITRIFSALGAVGVDTCYMIPDESGIADRVKRAIGLGPPEGQVWPEVEFIDMPIEESAADTLEATARMVERGVGGIMVLGGDGTNRLVAQACDGVPLTSLSTGTNNVFPMMREATIAGLAAGLVATGALQREEASRRNKVLRVTVNGAPRDIALVDVCVSGAAWTGAKALWRAEALDQLFVTFAEADAIGLSSIAGLVRPVSRDAPTGVAVDLGSVPGAARTVSAPLAPGLMADIGVERVFDLEAGVSHPIRLARGVLALDGEREVTFGPEDRVAVVLEPDGPLTVEIPRAMELAARSGLLEQAAEMRLSA
ncbi:MAG: NAD(+)/NADH kinase [Rhodospirillales bacterium]|nr:NAD(+)/NADH kinase [Rhodospirillales bacterium]